MKNFHPILYSTPMVQAILEKRKTKTRRTKGLEIVNDNPDRYVWLKDYPQIDIPRQAIPFDDKFYYAFTGKHNNSFLNVVTCPYGKVGDVLWVKETHYKYGWWIEDAGEFTKTGKQKTKFIATNKVLFEQNKPKHLASNSSRYFLGWYKRLGRFMFKKDARIFLEITDIKIERLHDISEEDAKQEGVEKYFDSLYFFMDYKTINDNPPDWKGNAYASFASLWEKINGKESWEANPFVWVISFKQIEKPENFI